MNYNVTPKSRVLEDEPFCKSHRRIIESETFEASAQFALLEYSHQLTASKADPSAAHYMLVGAHQFLSIFRNLAEKLEIPKSQDSTNLALNR